jgi:hypothetical protein
MKYFTKNIFSLLFSLLIVNCNVVFSQSIARSVISSGGNYSHNSNGGLYANVGELQINDFPITGYYLTEAFVQPEIYLSVIAPSHNLQSADISVFPNPATNSIAVICSNDKVNIVQIFDTQGRKVLEDKSGSTTAKQKLSINIMDLDKGVYFIKTITGKGLESIMRFVKM